MLVCYFNVSIKCRLRGAAAVGGFACPPGSSIETGPGSQANVCVAVVAVFIIICITYLVFQCTTFSAAMLECLADPSFANHICSCYIGHPRARKASHKIN